MISNLNSMQRQIIIDQYKLVLKSMRIFLKCFIAWYISIYSNTFFKKLKYHYKF